MVAAINPTSPRGETRRWNVTRERKRAEDSQSPQVVGSLLGVVDRELGLGFGGQPGFQLLAQHVERALAAQSPHLLGVSGPRSGPFPEHLFSLHQARAKEEGGLGPQCGRLAHGPEAVELPVDEVHELVGDLLAVLAEPAAAGGRGHPVVANRVARFQGHGLQLGEGAQRLPEDVAGEAVERVHPGSVRERWGGWIGRGGIGISHARRRVGLRRAGSQQARGKYDNEE
jgi:hypothetical protein